MDSLGTYLKRARNKKNFSLRDVEKKCGIKNSKLSRVERNRDSFKPSELRMLANLYDIDIIKVYLLSGILMESDIKNNYMFENVDMLNDEEIKSIQTIINIYTRERVVP